MGLATANGFSRESVQPGSGVSGVSSNEAQNIARQATLNRGGDGGAPSSRRYANISGAPGSASNANKAPSGSIFADYNKTSKAWPTHEFVEISPVFNLVHVPWWVGIGAAFGQGMSSASGPY